MHIRLDEDRQRVVPRIGSSRAFGDVVRPQPRAAFGVRLRGAKFLTEDAKRRFSRDHLPPLTLCTTMNNLSDLVRG